MTDRIHYLELQQLFVSIPHQVIWRNSCQSQNQNEQQVPTHHSISCKRMYWRNCLVFLHFLPFMGWNEGFRRNSMSTSGIVRTLLLFVNCFFIVVNALEHCLPKSHSSRCNNSQKNIDKISLH